MSKTYSAGIVTAYGAAKRAGYQGTYEDFCRQQAGYAGNAAAVEQAKTDAINAKNDAISAKNDAVSAKGDAVSAKNDAVSAKDTAVVKAQEASQSATSAGQSATSASQSATNASQSATSAGQSATDAEQSAQSVSASVQQIATNTTDIGKLKADLADVTNHAVKSAEQLLSDKRTTDKVPYKYRASASGKSDRAYDMIVGGTVGFNQLVRNGNFADASVWISSNGVEFTVSNNIASLSIAATEAQGLKRIGQSINFIEGHKLFISFGYAASLADKDIVFYAGSSSRVLSTIHLVSAMSWAQYCGIVNTKMTEYATFVIGSNGAQPDSWTINLRNFMLFDLTAMFGTTIADYIYSLEQATAGAGVALFRTMFNKDYYPYNAGSLISVEGLSAHVMRDEDNNIIGSYPLDNTLTLRGVPVLKDGKIEFDGDEYASDGTVTRRYGIVNLGTLNWSLYGGYLFFSSGLASIAKKNGNLFAVGYSKGEVPVASPPDLTMQLASSGDNVILRMTNTAYNDAESFKTAMSGVYLIYELATPTTETVTPYTSPQIVSPYGTEEYVSISICPVGHVTEYPDNLRAKLDGLPWDLSIIAPVETAYTATRNYTTGQLLIVDNTLYKVTANIANNGTITPNSNVTATTLSEVISALA